jgi:histidyl-tRNA synthetase
MNSMNKLQTLKGFRDFLPEEKKTRDVITQKLVEGFTLFGFEPLETPTLEYASLLLGKYGTEADKLVWQFEDKGKRQVALRYDQTVPTARVLAQYQNQLPKFFRRYQIQSNYRAEKPQRGRYREFTQADADIFGTLSPIADAEIIALYYWLNQSLGLDSIQIKINDRNSLVNTLKPFTNDLVSVNSLIQSIDKLDKKSTDEIVDELVKKGLPQTTASEALEKLNKLEPSGLLVEITNLAINLGVPPNTLRFTPTLARGLDYYTGLIFEGFVPEYEAGSLGGGGRYDRLIDNLSGVDIPAVGFGLGLDRTYEALKALGKLPALKPASTALIAIISPAVTEYSLNVASTLRQENISLEVYPATETKLTKQISYASKSAIPFVIIIGPNEAAANSVTLKYLPSGEQNTLLLAEAANYIKSEIPALQTDNLES